MNNNTIEEVLAVALGYRQSLLAHSIANVDSPYYRTQTYREHWIGDTGVELGKLTHYLKYQRFNADFWKDYQFKIDSKLDHEDLNIEDYVLGLTERNRLVWSNEMMSTILDFAWDKVVLDYGYGGCFYASHFIPVSRCVYGVERKDVYDFVRKNIIMPENYWHPYTTIKEVPALVDVIFVSEVFHSDTPVEIRMQIELLKTKLKPEGILVVNELKSGTILSKHFGIQMDIHTGGNGKLYSKAELNEVIGFRTREVDKEYQYHWMIGGKL